MTRSYGHPQISPLYLQRVMNDENFHGILYMSVVFMFVQVNFVMYIPLMMHALLESGQTMSTLLTPYLTTYQAQINSYTIKLD